MFSKISGKMSESGADSEETKCCAKLTEFAIYFCKSGSFAVLLENMIELIKKPVELNFYDVSYLFWVIRFFTTNFVLKTFVLNEAKTSAHKDSGLLTPAASSNAAIEKTFLNDTKSNASIRTKKALLSYDLISFIYFKIVLNFEQLIFDSNKENIRRIRRYRRMFGNIEVKQEFKKPTSATDPKYPPKVVNSNNLKVLYLSISCFNSLVDCINQHLCFSNSKLSRSSSKGNDEHFHIEFLCEFFNFNELKHLFPVLMRFYCYNEHIYSDQLIKTILLTNQIYLNTLEYLNEFLIMRKLMDVEKKRKRKSNKLELKDIYDMYANADTTFIIKRVLLHFVDNDPILNRCVIDLLDTLMSKSSKREHLFHMNLALALANIATMDNFRQFDQRTKDLVSNMLVEIRRLCKRKPNLANKVLLDIHRFKSNNNGNNAKRARIESHTTSTSTTTTAECHNESKSSNYNTSRSSLSSLYSTSNSNSSLSPHKLEPERLSPNGPPFMNSSAKKLNFCKYVSKELRIVIENEFLFYLRSIKTFSNVSYEQDLNPSVLSSCLIDNGNLYRFINSIIQIFEVNSKDSVTSWQIYNCLLNMKFDSSNEMNFIYDFDLLGIVAEHNNDPPGLPAFCVGYGFNKKEFLRSSLCYNLRIACSTDEFKFKLKEAYCKFIIEKLCAKSTRMRNSVHWIYRHLKRLKTYLALKKKPQPSDRIVEENFHILSYPTTSANIDSTSASQQISKFENILLNYFDAYQAEIPLIPFTYELQQVFHSDDFSYLLGVIGIVCSEYKFPSLPLDWFEPGSEKLQECITLIEKCI